MIWKSQEPKHVSRREQLALSSGERQGDKGVVTLEFRKMEVVGNFDKSYSEGTG